MMVYLCNSRALETESGDPNIGQNVYKHCLHPTKSMNNLFLLPKPRFPFCKMGNTIPTLYSTGYSGGSSLRGWHYERVPGMKGPLVHQVFGKPADSVVPRIFIFPHSLVCSEEKHHLSGELASILLSDSGEAWPISL